MEKLITAMEAAALLGIGKSLIYQLASDGDLPHVRIHSRLLFRVSQIEKFIESSTVENVINGK